MSKYSSPVVTLDGPSGSGKGTISLRIADALSWHYLDSGALYRIVGLIASRTSIPFSDEAGVSKIARSMQVEFIAGQVFLEGEPVEDEIRTEQAGNRASQVATLPLVRSALLEWQRQCAKPPGLVADGRDMGTVVFPNATCKIFLTATADARAQRRFNQLRLKGFDVNIRQLFEEITERDRRDAERKNSPLVPADDAITIDTTKMSIEQVSDSILLHIQNSGLTIPDK
ncbi:MAG: (d)CMP kinase [Acidiferrobacterales bacterium]|nr:(d)CMP kinase [Acidiferrobacterales bacterium]